MQNNKKIIIFVLTNVNNLKNKIKQNIMEYIVRENVLTDNILKVAPKGKIFKGGFVAILREYTFQNEWQDKETIKRFRSFETLHKYLDKYYTEEETENLDFTDTCLDF